jgi:dipeptidyl aminopeptidase/acylaminoacyl peptidase
VTGFTDVWPIRPIGGGRTREIPVGAGIKWPSSWSPDGRHVLFTESGEGAFDVGLVDLDASPPAKSTYLDSQFEEAEPRISPDGRWVAYESTESGSREVYVQSFPVPGAKARVSSNGGRTPLWRPDGRGVFFLGADGSLFEADLRLGSGAVGVATAATRRLFTVPGEPFATKHRRSFDVSADGQRFLVNLVVPDQMPRGLTVIVNGTPGGRR